MVTEVTIVDTPSINPKMTPPTIAFLNATLIPPIIDLEWIDNHLPLIASTPPVMNPAAIALKGSSFYL